MEPLLDVYKSYIGQRASNLPTPALVISRPILEANIRRLHEDVSNLGISFRPHTKTLKSIQVSRLMLANGKYRKVVTSTLPEIQGLLPLVKEGLIEECLYGIPLINGALPRLAKLRKSVKIDLLVDHGDQITCLENFVQTHSASPRKWHIFIKIDVGSKRAGLSKDSDRLREVVNRAVHSRAVLLRGFYCHAGHSYHGRTLQDAQNILQNEVDSVLHAVSLLPAERPVEVSIGATPTAHVIQSLRASLPPNVLLELHAGNFPTNDLQQVSTGLVSLSDQAVRVCAEVCSIYPERNEALVNAGVIALAREVSAYPGFGVISDNPEWRIVRVSQEHGIVGHSVPDAMDKRIDEAFHIGQKVFIYCQHSCITAAGFYAYYVVDEQDVVEDVWIPWKYW